VKLTLLQLEATIAVASATWYMQIITPAQRAAILAEAQRLCRARVSDAATQADFSSGATTQISARSWKAAVAQRTRLAAPAGAGDEATVARHTERALIEVVGV
jgi:hypothetical protein